VSRGEGSISALKVGGHYLKTRGEDNTKIYWPTGKYIIKMDVTEIPYERMDRIEVARLGP
jgi:hypothetical protein